MVRQGNRSAFVEELINQARAATDADNNQTEETVTLQVTLTRQEAEAFTLLQSVDNTLVPQAAAAFITAINKLLQALATLGLNDNNKG